MLNEQIVRSRYDISAYDIVALPTECLPTEMVNWLASTEYINEKLSYPVYCELKGYEMKLGPGAAWVAGKVYRYVRDEN